VLEFGWLQNHARTKPRGYAGDHEMLAKIAADWRCEHPLGRHFDAFFQSQAAPEAVRARIALCGERVAESAARQSKEAAFRVASIGCGPALDLVHAARLLPQKARTGFHVTLLDLDEEALAAAATHLSPWLAPQQVTLVRTNLFRLAQRPNDLGGPFDALLCTGLFDYLEPAAAVGLVKLFWQSLSPGGWLVIGNFGPENPTRAYMEWIGNWYLKYRTAAELMDLAEQAGIPRGSASVMAERTGVNLMLHARRE
jgi:SAM-dependent methyltransferase